MIEIPDNTTDIRAERVGDGVTFYKEIPMDKLTSYTEPDEDESLWDKGYSCGLKDGRRQGLDEAWELAQEIDARTPDWEWQDMTYSEAKAKYEEWRKQKDEIRVGDEIEYDGCNGQEKFIVFKINSGRYMGIGTVGDYSIFDSMFDAWNWVDASDITLRKTGRYFPEVAELLKKMGK